MTYLQAVLLGLIHGISEFLPISESGHMAIFLKIFGLTGDAAPDGFFLAMLYFGSLVAIVTASWKQLWWLVKGMKLPRERKTVRGRRQPGQRLPKRILFMLAVGILPSIGGLWLQRRTAALSGNLFFVAGMLMLTGFFLFISERAGQGDKDERTMYTSDAAAIGIGQAVSLIPGLSRTGLTLSIAAVGGLSRNYGVQFSYLLFLPLLLAEALISAAGGIASGVSEAMVPQYLIAAAASGICSYLGIRIMEKLAQKSGFTSFVFYIWGAAIIACILALIG